MFPPIYKSANGLPVERRGNAVGSSYWSDNNTKQVVAPGLSSPSRAGYPDPRSNGQSTTGSLSPALDHMAVRMQSLERENERFREEIQQLRQFYSSNQQQHDNDQLSVDKIAEDLQRLANSFSIKLQADTSHQQREQQKAALLFAEVSRLGHRVEGLGSDLKGIVDDTQRKFEAQDQNAQFLASVSTKQQQAVSPSRSIDYQRQLRDMQEVLMQLRSDMDTDRSSRWKNDAAVDAKIDAQLERLILKLAADKRDLVRVLDEQRELVLGADFQRVTSHMREFSRLNDHLMALERWLHSEFSQVKRIFQASASDVDTRFQCVLSELANGLKLWHAAQIRQEEEAGRRFQDLEDATRAFALTVQRKLRTLEEVIPLEVQARQKNDDKLRRRVEGVVKALDHAIETSRGEYLPQQSSLVDRLQQLELVQQTALSLQQRPMCETDRSVIEELCALQSWITKHEQECREYVQAVPTAPIASPVAVATHVSGEVQAEFSSVKEKLRALQEWTTMHAQECRQFFDFLNWSMDDARRESVVRQCLDAVIDQIVETEACGHLTTLMNGVNGALEQVAAVRFGMDVAVPPTSIAAPLKVKRIKPTSPAPCCLQLPAQEPIQRMESSARSFEDATDMLDLSTTTYDGSVDEESAGKMDRLNTADEGYERIESDDKQGSPSTSPSLSCEAGVTALKTIDNVTVNMLDPLVSAEIVDSTVEGQPLPAAEIIDGSPLFASILKPTAAELDDEEEYSTDISQDDSVTQEHPALSHTKSALYQKKLDKVAAEPQANEHLPDQANHDTEEEEPLTLDL